MRNSGKCLGVKCYRPMGALRSSLRSLGKCLSVWVVFCAATSLASPKTLIIGAGNCSEEAFLKNMELFTSIAQGKGETDLIQLTPLFEKRKLLAPRPMQEEQSMLETVHSKLLLGDYAAAYQGIEEVLDALENAAPSVESWQLIARALAMRGFAQSMQRKTRFSDETFTAILRLDADYQLDHLIFPPTVVQNFERLRETLGKRPKATLSVSSSPSGAMVFANGAPLGQTPLARELLPGAYHIVLEKEGKVSQPWSVQLGLGSPKHLDIPFEWEAAWRTPLCLLGEEEEAASTSRQMAKSLGASYLVKVDKLLTKEGVRAVLVDVSSGKTIREGGVLLEDSQREAHLGKLASFILLGKVEKGENVVWPLSEQGKLLHPAFLSTDGAKDVSGWPAGGALRITSWVFIGAGSALSLGGGLMYLHSLKPAADAKALRNKYGEQHIYSAQEAYIYNAAVSRKEDRRKAALIMGASGAASLATGLVLFFVFPPPAEGGPQVGIVPHIGAEGGGLSLFGQF